MAAIFFKHIISPTIRRLDGTTVRCAHLSLRHAGLQLSPVHYIVNVLHAPRILTDPLPPVCDTHWRRLTPLGIAYNIYNKLIKWCCFFVMITSCNDLIYVSGVP